jgi:voltage-gated potassium channel
MLTEEVQSPGISQVYTQLMTHGGGNTYSVRLPDELGPISYGDCQLRLGQSYAAAALAARTGDDLMVSPPWSARLPTGTVLYYVSQRPITIDKLLEALGPARAAPDLTSP